MKRGFTLAEMLVVISVLSVVGVIITTIFIRNLRGSNKSQIISQIKQNGQTVLETMDKTIKNADNLVCIIPNTDNTDNTVYTMVVEKGGLYTRYRLTPPQDQTVPPACLTNGCIAQDNPTKEPNQATGKEETDPEFIMRVCIPNDSMQSANILTDTNTQTGVKVLRGVFSEADKEQSAGFKKAVKIFFVLGAGAGAAPAVTGQIDPVTFETTVQLR